MASGCTLPTANTPRVSNTAAAAKPDPRVAKLHDDIVKIAPFFKVMGPPKPADWLTAFKEPGETFDQWLASDPTLPNKDRRKIYVLPLGRFTSKQTRVIKLTAGYLAAFYGLPVEELSWRPLDATFPNVRHSNLTKTRQVKTGYILEKLLSPILPNDAAALVALTEQDLFSEETTNYVFGQASLEKRVGVWSLYRLQQNVLFDTLLHRMLKIASHETGHMFSMHHCTKYECIMSGTNHLGETDRRPIDACPECMAKICWLSDQWPASRYKRLAVFCRANGLIADAAEFDRKAVAVSDN